MPILLEIKVVPQSGKQRFVTDKSGILKCFLKSPPEDGKANKELIKLLSEALSIPQDHIKIVLGATFRKKVLKIDTPLDQKAIWKKLGIEEQLRI